MIDFETELASILAKDPLGLLVVKPKVPSAISADARLIASFAEINDFIADHGHEPTASRDINERKLYSRLKGLRSHPEKSAALSEFDTHSLLAETACAKEIKSIDDVLGDDVLGLLGGNDLNEEEDGDIFNLTHVYKVVDKPDFIAKRKPCKEFKQFEPLFKQVHADLASKEKKTIPFKSERQIVPGEFFVLQGMLVLVANQGKWEKRNFGNINARLYCVFENGTESNMLLRSLAAALWKDKDCKQVIDSKQMELFKSKEKINKDDESTGFVYVLRSLSNDPQVKEIENLYKVGFSGQPVADRIQNAANEPTYLMADVLPVIDFQTYNLNPQKLEKLLHTFFSESCLEMDVFDSDGKRHTPREWFQVPLHIIETAVDLLINGDILNYRYDSLKQEIVAK